MSAIDPLRTLVALRNALARADAIRSASRPATIDCNCLPGDEARRRIAKPKDCRGDLHRFAETAHGFGGKQGISTAWHSGNQMCEHRRVHWPGTDGVHSDILPRVFERCRAR